MVANDSISRAFGARPPADIASDVSVAITPELALCECRAVSTASVSFNSYSFHFQAKSLDFSGIIGGRRVDFREATGPSFIPMGIDMPFRSEVTMPVKSPIYSAVIQRSSMEATAEELFEVGRIDLEEERLRAPEGFGNLLARFFAEAFSPELDARLAAESLAALIIVDFQRSLWPGRVSRGALGPQFRHPGITRARRTILREYRSGLGVVELAQIANLSVTQFISVFKRETGETPHQFLRRVRVDNAQRLLARGFDVIDAGFSVGFSSVSGFRSAFKKLVGMTPEEYWLLRRK